MEIRAFKDPVSGRIFETEQELNDFLADKDRNVPSAKVQELIAANAKHLAERLTYAADFSEVARAQYIRRLEIFNKHERDRGQPPLSIQEFFGALQVQSALGEVMVTARVRVKFNAKPASDEAIDALSPARVLSPFAYALGFYTEFNNGAYQVENGLSARLRDLPLLEQRIALDWELQNRAHAHWTKIEAQANEAASKDEQVLALSDEIYDIEQVFAQLSKNLADKRSQYNERKAEVRQKFISDNPCPDFEATQHALERLKSLKVAPHAGDELLKRLYKSAS